MVKNPPATAGDARDPDLTPGWGRSPEGGNDNPLQYSCLGNPMDRGAWWDHLADHTLITCLSCTDHVADHALITKLIIH